MSAADVERLAASAEMLDELDVRITHCRACPRLVAWREQVARDKRAAYATETYWGRPVPGWGDAQPRILIAGLAPADFMGEATDRQRAVVGFRRRFAPYPLL